MSFLDQLPSWDRQIYILIQVHTHVEFISTSRPLCISKVMYKGISTKENLDKVHIHGRRHTIISNHYFDIVLISSLVQTFKELILNQIEWICSHSFLTCFHFIPIFIFYTSAASLEKYISEDYHSQVDKTKETVSILYAITQKETLAILSVTARIQRKPLLSSPRRTVITIQDPRKGFEMCVEVMENGNEQDFQASHQHGRVYV